MSTPTEFYKLSQSITEYFKQGLLWSISAHFKAEEGIYRRPATHSTYKGWIQRFSGFFGDIWPQDVKSTSIQKPADTSLCTSQWSIYLSCINTNEFFCSMNSNNKRAIESKVVLIFSKVQRFSIVSFVQAAADQGDEFLEYTFNRLNTMHFKILEWCLRVYIHMK